MTLRIPSLVAVVATLRLPIQLYDVGFEQLRNGYAVAMPVVMVVLTALIVLAQWRLMRRWRIDPDQARRSSERRLRTDCGSRSARVPSAAPRTRAVCHCNAGQVALP